MNKKIAVTLNVKNKLSTFFWTKGTRLETAKLLVKQKVRVLPSFNDMAQNDSGTAQHYLKGRIPLAVAQDTFAVVSHQEADGTSWLSGFSGILFQQPLQRT